MSEEKKSDGDRMLQYRDVMQNTLLWDESERLGLMIDGQPIGWWALLRHIYNNRDAAHGFMRFAVEELSGRIERVEAILSALEVGADVRDWDVLDTPEKIARSAQLRVVDIVRTALKGE